jgi:hypothetical protein
MNQTIFKTGKKYTFGDYFYLRHPTEEIINALGYSFCVTDFQFPISQELNQAAIDRLTNSYYYSPKLLFTVKPQNENLSLRPCYRKSFARWQLNYT